MRPSNDIILYYIIFIRIEHQHFEHTSQTANASEYNELSEFKTDDYTYQSVLYAVCRFNLNGRGVRSEPYSL